MVHNEAKLGCQLKKKKNKNKQTPNKQKKRKQKTNTKKQQAKWVLHSFLNVHILDLQHNLNAALLFVCQEVDPESQQEALEFFASQQGPTACYMVLSARDRAEKEVKAAVCPVGKFMKRAVEAANCAWKSYYPGSPISMSPPSKVRSQDKNLITQHQNIFSLSW
jgi:hypothetical protein